VKQSGIRYKEATHAHVMDNVSQHNGVEFEHFTIFGHFSFILKESFCYITVSLIIHLWLKTVSLGKQSN
jgi:hypothetical protein